MSVRSSMDLSHVIFHVSLDNFLVPRNDNRPVLSFGERGKLIGTKKILMCQNYLYTTHVSILDITEPDNNCMAKTDGSHSVDIDDADDEDQCIICRVKKINTIIRPCNHYIMCTDCANELIRRLFTTCPVCRAEICELTTVNRKAL